MANSNIYEAFSATELRIEYEKVEDQLKQLKIEKKTCWFLTKNTEEVAVLEAKIAPLQMQLRLMERAFTRLNEKRRKREEELFVTRMVARWKKLKLPPNQENKKPIVPPKLPPTEENFWEKFWENPREKPLLVQPPKLPLPGLEFHSIVYLYYFKKKVLIGYSE